MYLVDEDLLEQFADDFAMLQEDVLGGEFSAQRYAARLCSAYALIESTRAQRAERGRVPAKRPAASALFAERKKA